MREYGPQGALAVDIFSELIKSVMRLAVIVPNINIDFLNNSSLDEIPERPKSRVIKPFIIVRADQAQDERDLLRRRIAVGGPRKLVPVANEYLRIKPNRVA